MSRKLLTAIFITCLSLFCTKAMAAVDAVAKIGDTTYRTLAAAFEAASQATDQQTIVLTSNVTLDDKDYIEVTKSVTLDLAGYSITGNKTSGSNSISGLLHVNNGEVVLTITDNGTGSKGSISNNNASGTAVSVSTGTVKTNNYTVSSVTTSGTLTLDGADIALLKVKNGATTINGGNITAVTVANGATLVTNGGTFSFDPTAYTPETSDIAAESGSWKVTPDAYNYKVVGNGKVVKTQWLLDAFYAGNKMETDGKKDDVTIYVLTDVNDNDGLFDTYNLFGNFTIEGGNHTVVLWKGLEIYDSKLIINSGTFQFVAFWAGKAGLSVTYKGSLEINGGTIDTTQLPISSIKVSDNSDAHVAINGGTIVSKQDAIEVQTVFPYDNINITGGTLKPGNGFRAISSASNVSLCLAKGYDFYNMEDGKYIDANVNTLPKDVVVSAKPIDEFVYNNFEFKVTDNDIPNNKFAVTLKGMQGEPSQNNTITIPANAIDPYNSNNVYLVESIADETFAGNSSVAAVDFENEGKNLKRIGDKAFYATPLVMVTIPENVEYIGKSAFGDNDDLLLIYYNASNVNTIYTASNYPFSGSDKNVFNLFVGENVQSIPNYMFYALGDKTWDNTDLCVEAKAKSAPSIESATFSSFAKEHYTLETPNAVNNSYLTWGFTNYTLNPKKLELTDTYPVMVEGTYPAGKMSYSRSVATVGNYGSFCIPFGTQIPTDAFENVWVPVNVALIQDDQLCILFEEISGSIPAGTPFLAKWKGNNVTFTNTNDVTISGSLINPAPQTIKTFDFEGNGSLFQNNDYDVAFGGTIVSKAWQNGLYQFLTDGSFQQRAESAGAFIPYRAYVTKTAKTSSAKSLTIVGILEGDDGTVDSIIDLQTAKNIHIGKDGVYTLDGRKLSDASSLPHGIYIVNGKKIAK